MSAIKEFANDAFAQGFEIRGPDQVPIWTRRHPRFIAGKMYEWHGRYQLNGGQALHIIENSTQISLQVAGFLFTS